MQKLAYQSEARIYGDWSIEPLTQTMAQVEAQFGTHLFLIATLEDLLVGSVRGYLTEGVGRIGKLIVHPEYQNRGIGQMLMASMEAALGEAQRFELFTGDRSAKNLILYEKLGYQVCRTRQVNETLTLVYLEKPRVTRLEGG